MLRHITFQPIPAPYRAAFGPLSQGPIAGFVSVAYVRAVQVIELKDI